jgi:nucleotidyltransferase substrate binding protein (TIGR01987 family)
MLSQHAFSIFDCLLDTGSMPLELNSFRNAIAQCDNALMYCHSDLAKSDTKLAQHLRAGAIQAFEFTYELTFKMLRRFLQSIEDSPSLVDEMSFNQLVRRGYEIGVLEAEIEHWKEFRKNRGTTSHTYDMAKAELVFDGIPAFLIEAKFLLRQIEMRQNGQS